MASPSSRECRVFPNAAHAKFESLNFGYAQYFDGFEYHSIRASERVTRKRFERLFLRTYANAKTIKGLQSSGFRY